MKLENLYQAYKELDCTFDPFYQKECPELQVLVDKNSPISSDFLEEMKVILSKDDESSRQYFIMDFLKLYKEEIPQELYDPIFDAGIRHRDPSFNRLFFIICTQMKGREAFMNDVIRCIKGDDLFRKIKAILSLYWNFHLYWSYAIEDNDSFETYIKPRISGHKEEIEKILLILMKEFQESDNFFVRYILATYLPKTLSRYPKEKQAEAQEIITQIKKEGLPLTHKASKEEFKLLWKKAIDEEEIGRLFFDQLKWRSRDADPNKDS